MSSPAPYDRAQIARWFDTYTVARGEALVGSVTSLERGEDTLSGVVRVFGRRANRAEVYFHRVGTELLADCDCTCTDEYDCEHVVAVLLAGLDRPEIRAGTLRAELVSWLELFRERQAAERTRKTKKPSQALAYVVERSSYQQAHDVRFFKASLDREGRIRNIGDSWNNVDNAIVRPPQFVGDDDLAILRLLWVARTREHNTSSYGLSGVNGAEVLERMLATGRLFTTNAAAQVSLTALRRGSERPGRMHWKPRSDDRLRPVLQTDPPASTVILTQPPWYVDELQGEAGLARLPWDTELLGDYLSMPAVSSTEASDVSAALHSISPELPTPPVHDETTMRVVDVEPVPVLRLDSLPVYATGYGRIRPNGGMLDHATVAFHYDGFIFDAGSTTTLVEAQDGKLVHVKRRGETEKRRLAELRRVGLEPIQSSGLYGPKTLPAAMLGLGAGAEWPDFMGHVLPELRRTGWRAVMANDFRFNVVEIETIDGRVELSADGWFDLEMGIVVGERKVRLEPLLAELFRRDPRWLTGALEDIADDEAIELRSDGGERLRMRADRVKPVVRVLVDLFDNLGSGSLRVSRFDAGRLEALSDTGRWLFHGEGSLHQLAQRLRNAGGVNSVPAPQGLHGELRAYQLQGLSWMQFLREQELSGVLADDMGLGKTIQTLAHLLAEKEAGRLDRPALIVVPTSLVNNWCEEARKFAPSLRVLSLHGAQRKDSFERIGQHDLILTTYALLWRDQQALAKQAYHVLILDEAQFVKNASTKSAAAVRELQSRQRLCLTGTPLENHLGELWSLFDFLLPGFLGSQQDFNRRWRTPIEKGADTVRRDLLARRIRPFMLRRRKDEVAKELPPKTMIVRSVELEGAQRDLYETVRAAMQEKVRAAIADQGLQRSHIVVLDAMLKLRQVCCDPRLVKLETARRVEDSAKLELLLSILPDLIEEGRRVLLFSQFTGMLALIADAVTEAGIAYVTLTGDTTDRVTPVRRFQNGEVPLFLISLKAGGVGLNLTAADAVIHYDPWWNPAAENQATDRAHRLGQDKPVFVYKLIVAGSIEEKIVQLQQKKAALVEGILSNDAAAAVKFSNDDLDALFAPMPSPAR
jgi:superfamily II DNA or RNA helicase